MTIRTAIIKQDNWIINMYVDVDSVPTFRRDPDFVATKTRKHWIITSNSLPVRNIILEREKKIRSNNVITAYEKEDEYRIDLASIVINHKSFAPATIKLLLPKDMFWYRNIKSKSMYQTYKKFKKKHNSKDKTFLAIPDICLLPNKKPFHVKDGVYKLNFYNKKSSTSHINTHIPDFGVEHLFEITLADNCYHLSYNTLKIEDIVAFSMAVSRIIA